MKNEIWKSKMLFNIDSHYRKTLDIIKEAGCQRQYKKN